MSPHERAIRRARRAIRLASAGVRFADTLAAALTLALTLAVVDATSPLAPAARLTLALLAGLVALALLTRAALAARCSLLGAASRLEAAMGLTRNTLLNALQLSAAGADGPIAADRTRLAGRRADELVSGSPRTPIIDRRSLAAPLARLAIASALFAVFLLVMPRVAQSGWLRFTQPFDGQPPYSRTEFELSHEPEPLLATNDASIRVRTTLVVPETLELVNIESGERVQLAQPEPGVFTTTLTRLTKPVTLFADGPTGRSREHTITPIDRPIIERAVARLTVDGRESLAIEIDPSGEPPTLRAPLGSVVEIEAFTSVPLSRAVATNSAQADAQDRRATARLTVESTEPFDLTLTPLSRSGLASEPGVTVRVEPVTPNRGNAADNDAPADQPAAQDEPSDTPPGPMQQALDALREQIEQMTDEQLAEQGETLIEQIDEALAQDAETADEQEAESTLSTLREALAEMIEGVPGSSDTARNAVETDEEPPPAPDDKAERGDPESDRDQLITDGARERPSENAPSPHRLEGDTLVLEGGPSEEPLRISLDAAARDLYASLSDSDRALVARYFRELAKIETNDEAAP